MFQRFVAILLIAAVMSSGFTKCFVFASFRINQKYIAENLCINRDKPWLHCDGKCYLMKKLKQAEEKEQKQDRENQKHLVQDSFFAAAEKPVFSNILLAIFYARPSNQYSYLKNLSVFQPPEA